MFLIGRPWVSRFGALVVGITLMGIAFAESPAAHADGAWLDAPLSNWNHPNMAVPHAPLLQEEPGNPQCLGTVRPPESDEDSAVAAAGWKLVGTYQGGYGAKVITATTSFDGMCRPIGYQVFVFYHQHFVGTLSPEPMASRTDGAENQVFLSPSLSVARPPSVIADFSRYTDADALCCPSRISHVNYDIEFAEGGWVLVPKSVSTDPTQ